MSSEVIAERQQHWLDHILAAEKFSDTQIVSILKETQAVMFTLKL